MTDVQPQHSERAHALLSASGASRWLNCPPSARLTEHIEEQRSVYADEGTAAHELAELYLTRRLTICYSAERDRLEAAMEMFKTSNQFYGPEMEAAVQYYVELVEERYVAAKARSADAVVMLEERLDYSEWVPDGYGTGDVVLISDGVMEIIDLKYGKGVPVSAVGNPQMRLYALGAWSAYNFLYDIQEVRMTIVQPRLDSVSTDAMHVDELTDWAELEVRPRAEEAFKGEGEFKAGDHCRWCKVKGNCRARADANLQLVAHEFKDPPLLEIEEISSILYVSDQLAAWAKDVAEYAQEQAVRGVKIPQWKLVEGRSNRKITDTEAAKAALLQTGVEPDKYLKPQELYGIGELEKRVGKKQLSEALGDLIAKPPGKPVLVPETDKRPELNSVEGDFAGVDFGE